MVIWIAEMSFRDVIKRRRFELGLTQEEVALRMGKKTYHYVYKVESGVIKDPGARSIKKFADALEMDASVLIDALFRNNHK